LKPSGTLFNPFPGLRPFQPEEDHLFFGREKEIDDLLRRLRSTRFLSVVGTSGSGKSSLIRSGLIPALQGGFMVQAGSSWRVCILRPGEDPIGHLARALNGSDVLGKEGELATTNQVLVEATLRRGTLGLVEAVRHARLSRYDNLLVVVDQFEELFRFQRSREHPNSREEAVAFVKLLLEATRQSAAPIYVVLTMRSDFIGDCMNYPGLPEAVNAGQYLVPRMTRDELRSAITGPVAVGGGQIAPRLVLRLLNDVGEDQDQLPVLQHALMRTWAYWEEQRHPGQPIDLSDYEAVGSLRSALSVHADEAYEQTNSERGRSIAERMFKALTDTFSDPRGVRRPSSVQELAEICEASVPEVLEIIELFRHPGRCFLMPPSPVELTAGSIIDLSHESLMRCWRRLIDWAEEERLAAGSYARLSQAAAWFEEGSAGLWRNPELELGLQWRRESRPTAAWARRYDEHFQRAMAFLDRSEKESQRLEVEKETTRKRKMRLAWGVATVLGSLLLVTVLLFRIARKEEARAEQNLQLAQGAVNEMLSSAGRQSARVAEDVPQLEEFRRELLEKAQRFYLAFAEQKPRSEQLRQEVAAAHFRLGDINRLMGKGEESVKEYREAIQIFEGLARTHPRKPEYREALANSYNWLAETLRNSPNGRAEAEIAYNSALRLQSELLSENRPRAAYQQELARTHYNRGILRYSVGRENDSEADFRRAIGLLEPLTQKKEGAAPAQELARVYNNLASLLRHERKLVEAGTFYEHALTIDTELIKKNPDNREYKLELATFTENLALLLFDQFEAARQNNQPVSADLIEAAKRKNHEALDLIEELASPAPALGMELAKAHIVRGEMLDAQGSREAQRENLESLDLLGRMNKVHGAERHPEFHVLYTSLAYSFRDLARKYLQEGNFDDARNALQGLAQVLPQLSDTDRAKFEQSYGQLQSNLRVRTSKRKQNDPKSGEDR